MELTTKDVEYESDGVKIKLYLAYDSSAKNCWV